jgi:phosphatidylinositol alpha-1,6-mannosyltransferase
MTSARVLLLADVFPPAIGGSGDLMANIYGRMSGVPVTVLADADHGGLNAPFSNLEVIRHQPTSRQWGILHPSGLMRHVRGVLQIRRLLAAAGPTVVHCARTLPEGLAAWAVRKLGGPPYVCWAHGEEVSYARGSRELRALMSLVQHDADAILANSQNTAEVLRSAGAPADRIAVVYPGVDGTRFRPDGADAMSIRRKVAREGEVLLVTVGRLQRRKGHDLVIRAMAELRHSDPVLRYLIVGDGEERERLEQLARDHDVSDRVVFLGAVASEMLPSCYAAADIFVHPNRTEGLDFEGFGLVFLEAAAAGLPVIAGRTGGAPEAVEAGQTAVLVSGTDLGELVSSLQALLADPARCRAMGRAGRERALGQFSWDRAAELTRRAHERAASGSAGRSSPQSREV